MLKFEDFLKTSDSDFVNLDLEVDFNTTPLKDYFVISIPSIGYLASNVSSDKYHRAVDISQSAEAILLQSKRRGFYKLPQLRSLGGQI